MTACTSRERGKTRTYKSIVLYLCLFHILFFYKGRLIRQSRPNQRRDPAYMRCVVEMEASAILPAYIHRLPHPSLPVSTPSTIHHSRLTVCLPDSLDLDCCLSILFFKRL